MPRARRAGWIEAALRIQRPSRKAGEAQTRWTSVASIGRSSSPTPIASSHATVVSQS